LVVFRTSITPATWAQCSGAFFVVKRAQRYHKKGGTKLRPVLALVICCLYKSELPAPNHPTIFWLWPLMHCN